MIRKFIEEKKYDLAISELLKIKKNQDSIYQLLLLYRLTDRYDDEDVLIDEVLPEFPHWDYLHERKKWQILPEEEKLVPRKPLSLLRDHDTTPSQEILSQLCFSSAANSGLFFKFLVDLIHSIKVSTIYKDIPFYIFDEGLTDQEIITLLDLGVKEIVQPGWPSQILPGRSKIILPELIKGYRYYFFIDADVWIQDERGLDDFINLCLKQGIGGTYAPYKSFVQNKPTINGGLWCIDSKTPIFDLWSKNYKELVSQGGLLDQGELAKALDQLNISDRLNPLTHNYRGHNEHRSGCIINDNILLTENREIIKFMHLLEWDCDFKDRVDHHTYLKRACISKNSSDFAAVENKTITDQDKIIYLNYRSWPWADKDKIKNELIKSLRD